MKYVRTFLSTMALSASVAVGLHMADAETNTGERDLTGPVCTALLDGYEISGKLVAEDGAVYALISAANTTEEARTVEFNYAVNNTPAMSMMSRMGPVPRQVKKGTCTLKPDCGKQVVEKILVREKKEDAVSAEAPEVESVRQALVPSILALSAETWTLTISRGEIGAGGWGAVPPSEGPGTVALDKGAVVLASTRLQEVAPVVDGGTGKSI